MSSNAYKERISALASPFISLLRSNHAEAATTAKVYRSQINKKNIEFIRLRRHAEKESRGGRRRKNILLRRSTRAR